MNRSLIALWIALAAAIITIAALAQFWVAQRERSRQTRVQELLESRLVPVGQAIKRVLDEYAVEFERQTSNADLSLPTDCVELKRNPLIRSLVVIDRQQQVLFYPHDLRNANSDERALVDEAQQILRDRFPQTPAPATKSSTVEITQSLGPQLARRQTTKVAPDQVPPMQSESQVTNGAFLENPFAANTKWGTWYHRRGLMLGYIWEQDDRWQAIAVLPRARWMADIVSVLSDNASEPSNPRLESLRQLVDAEGKVIHQWSSLPQQQWPAMTSSIADAETPLHAPLEGWRLREFASNAYRSSLAGDDLQLPIWIAVSAMSVSLLLTGLLVTISINREVRLARQRVSFVNQVSHELRTPLTNICMYADLVAQSLEQDGTPSPDELQQQERLLVIRSESQRLSRLVNNVLEFARPTPTKKLQRSPEVLDAIVTETLATFEPKLAELDFEVVRRFNCGEVRMLDRGAVEQILVNLIGNAEKYAASGKYLCIETGTTDNGVEFTVSDHGPGVPARMHEQIFKPFVRMTDRLEDPAGTGIGLTIARELSQRHDGNCELLYTSVGASFRCTLVAGST